jgi:hypothetical protein
MACKLRVAARILEDLEDPEVAITACLLPSLEQLHGLPEIQEMFAVFLGGGVKSTLKKAERLENIMSVLFINHALYDFVSKYSSKYANPFTWPKIELKHRIFHPILNTHEILTKMSSNKEFVQQLKRVVIHWRACVYFAVNSRGEIILLGRLFQHKITVIYITGESKDFMLSVPTYNSKVVNQWSMDIAVDSNDNVYVVTQCKTRDKDGSDKRGFVLYAFDENYNIKHISALDFLDAGAFPVVNIAVDKNQNVIMLTNWNDQVYVCENTGKLKFQFFSKRNLDHIWLRSLSISSNNNIIIESDDSSAVQIYSTEGNLKSTIKVPEGHEVVQVAFHHGICKILVTTYVKKQDSWFLLGYSETSELENLVFFSKLDPEQNWQRGIYMTSHPCGPVTVEVSGIDITLL